MLRAVPSIISRTCVVPCSSSSISLRLAIPPEAPCVAFGRRLISDGAGDTPQRGCKKTKSWQRLTTLCWKQLIQMCTGRSTLPGNLEKDKTIGSRSGSRKPELSRTSVRRSSSGVIGKCPSTPPKPPRSDESTCASKDKDRSVRAKPRDCCMPAQPPMRIPPWCEDGVVKRKLKELQESFERKDCATPRQRNIYKRSNRCGTNESERYNEIVRRRKADKDWLAKHWARERLLDKEWEKAKQYYGAQQRMRKTPACKVKEHHKEKCGLDDEDKPTPRE